MKSYTSNTAFTESSFYFITRRFVVASCRDAEKIKQKKQNCVAGHEFAEGLR